MFAGYTFTQAAGIIFGLAVVTRALAGPHLNVLIPAFAFPVGLIIYSARSGQLEHVPGLAGLIAAVSFAVVVSGVVYHVVDVVFDGAAEACRYVRRLRNRASTKDGGAS